MKRLVQLLLVAMPVLAVAQDMNTHYNYLMNWYNVNPAQTGERDGIYTLLNHSAQWVGMEGAPSNSMFGIHSPFRKDMGFGGKIIYDQRGVFTNFSAELSYSYKVQLNADHKLSFGITAGLAQYYINANTIIDDIYTDETDPVATTSYFNSSNFQSGFGVLYKWKELEVGASAPHLARSGEQVSDHIFGMAKYRYVIEDYKLGIIPSVVYQHLTTSPSQIDAGLQIEWNELASLQAIYRSNNTMVFGTAVHIKNLHFGYSYVYGRQALNTISKGSNEILIAMQFDRRNKPVIVQTASGATLQQVLKDIKSMKRSAAPESSLKQEIERIQEELGQLLEKAKREGLSVADQDRINHLENRINQLKADIAK